MPMYGTYLTLAVLLLLAYVLWRASALPRLKKVRGRAFLAAGLLLALVFVCGRRLGHQTFGPWATALEYASWALAGTLFLVSACLLPVELLTGFGRFLPRLAALARSWAFGAGGLLAALALFQGLCPPQVTRFEVALSGLPRNLDGTRLAVFSDLHLGKLLGPGWLAARVRQIQALKPDMILELGDLFEGHGEPVARYLPALVRLSAPLGVWAVDGNHEMNGHRPRNAMGGDLLPTLRDRVVQPAPGLFLAGRRSRHSHGRETGTAWNPGAGSAAGAWILMTHVPVAAGAAARAGVGLMLAGHTHGGQLWPLSIATRMVHPLATGRYQVGEMTVLVSRGAGFWGPRMRLWRPGEIMLVTLRSAKRDAPEELIPNPTWQIPDKLQATLTPCPKQRRGNESTAANAVSGSKESGNAGFFAARCLELPAGACRCSPRLTRYAGASFILPRSWPGC